MTPSPTLIHRPPAAWPGNSILFTHAPDGVVWASSRGAVAGGRDEGESLAALDVAIRVAEWRPAASVPAATWG